MTGGGPAALRLRRSLACAALGALGGCTLITDSFLTNDFSGDPFPVNVDTTSGAVVVGLRVAGAPDREVVLDVLSPITLVDPGLAAQPSVVTTDLTLLGQRSPGGALDLPRARFVESQLVSLHPCGNECATGAPAGCDPAQCNIGAAGALRPFAGIIGADVLAGDAVRLRLGDNQLFVLPDVGGDNRGRSLDCEAVFGSPYRGGGTLVIGGTELPFGNRRITLKACLGAEPEDTGIVDPTKLRPHQAGADAQLVVSTSIGITILGQSAFQRYLVAHPEPLDQPDPPVPGVVYLPSGPVSGGRTRIKRLSLVAGSAGNSLAPCRQVYAHRLLIAHGPFMQGECAADGAPADPAADPPTYDCVCKDHSAFCGVPATIELAPPGGIAILVVPDDEPTLQALRAELRPDQAEIDGLLGTDVLRGAEIDVDYPHDRLIARCTSAGCVARAQFDDENEGRQIYRCLYGVLPPR